jgi:hypothetical protein
MNEGEGIRPLTPILLITDHAYGGMLHTRLEAKITLESATHSLKPPGEDVDKAWGRLTQSVVDHAIGYISEVDASHLDVSAPFTEAQAFPFTLTHIYLYVDIREKA